MILAYVKGFLVLFLLIKVLLYFVPKNVFGKYIAFFAGVILVIGMLYPLMQFWGQEEVVLEKLEQEAWEERILKITAEAKQMQDSGKRLMEEKYQNLIEEPEDEIVVDTISVKIVDKMQAGEMDE
ncbi:MAG: stage III sporulation protein AF [Roseburia sp.]|nr:stage III sporulation protein AF [Roseburia sp.]